jgi:hypothetical protein
MLDGGVAAETVSVSVAVCVRLPEVPVKLTVDVATAALDDAVSVMLCAVPGVSVRLAGFAVTPLGRPVMAMVTAAVKPLLAVALTLTAPLPEPAVRPSVDGVKLSVKSGGGAAAATVNVNVAACVRPPEVPVKLTVDVATVALDDAVSVVLCAVPGVRVSVAGFAVTPLGKPVIAIVTGPLNPLDGLALTLTAVPAAPAVRLNVAGVKVTVKSGAAATVSVRDAACVRLPEVPVKLTVDVATAALDDAVSVVLCAVPGVRVSVAGLAVTPVGRPVMATVTGAVSPLDGLAWTLTAVPAEPAVRLNVAGDRVSVKLGAVAAATVSANAAACVRLPEVPVKVTVDVAAAALEDAVSVVL